MWDVVFWQHPFLTSGQHELDIWNSIQKNIVNDLSTHITVISFTPEIQVSATAYLVWATLLGMSMYL